MFPFISSRRAGAVAALAATLLLPALTQADDLGDLVRSGRTAAAAPGMAAAVITSDSIEVRSAGVRKSGAPGRVTVRDSFGIGSDAKAMLSTVIAQEVEAGRLRWDQTIGEILPDVMATARLEYHRVTLAQLLNHLAGLPQLLTLEELAVIPPLRGSIVRQRLAFARWALAQPAVVPPGSATTYSNAGYVVAAAILERVTGRRYEVLLQERLFAPLRMQARFEWPAAGGRRNEPWGHAFVDGRAIPVSPDDPASRLPEWANPAGNVSMNARDFARFVQLHLRGLRGTSTFLAPSTFDHLHTPTLGYAYGWAVMQTGDGMRISFHAGSSELFYAYMVVIPALDIAAVVLANTESPQMEQVANQLAFDLMAARLQR
ncbi:MAG: serine hydrolase domain-containing protein [Steroidobacteraceae bacterium]